MTTPDTLDTMVLDVLCEVLKVPADDVTDEVRRGSLEEWDSLGHVMLVGALADRFGIEITPESALRMQTVADVKRIVGELTT